MSDDGLLLMNTEGSSAGKSSDVFLNMEGKRDVDKVSDFEAAVGMSRKWDAYEAGRETAESTIRQLKRPPDFFLLFSTIHYDKHGGFQRLLDGVWSVLPEGTPLIGGTVAGFINPQGCYTRGATALAVSYPNMDVAVGYGKNTKRNPKKAARQCAEMIKKGLKNSKYHNNFIFDIISGGLIPQIPGVGRRKVIRGVLSKIAIHLSNFSLIILQKGVGREEELLNEFEKYFKDFYILHGSSMDDGKATTNYQFIDKTVETNMIVALGINTDLTMDINQSHNFKEMKRFYVTKLSKDKRIIHMINNKPAACEVLTLLGWPDDFFDEKLFKRTFFCPVSYIDNDRLIPEIIGIIAGNSITVLHGIKNKEMAFLSASGKNLIEAVTYCLGSLDCKNSVFGLISTCDGRLETLGYKIFDIKEKITEQFGEKPFLAIYCGGEGIKKPNESFRYGNLTFNAFIMKKHLNKII